MSAAPRLLDRLSKVKQTGQDRWVACCPAHGDKSPSLSVREVEDRLLIHCFAGCAVHDVLGAVGLELRDLFDAPLNIECGQLTAKFRPAMCWSWSPMRSTWQPLCWPTLPSNGKSANRIGFDWPLQRVESDRLEGTPMAEKDRLVELQQQFDRAALAGTTEPVTRIAKSITPKELEPLWPGVLWIGKPTLLVGDPGLGKSMVTVDIVARVTKGEAWPCNSGTCAPSDVLMLSAEDDPDDTIVPRLIAAGADLERVTFMDAVREFDREGKAHERAISLDRHIETLRAALVNHPVKLVIIDPISAFLGTADSHNNAEVRALLAALGHLATEQRCAVLVVSHLNKGSGASAVYRITGSLAFVAAARAVYAIAKDPDDANRRLMLAIKSNLGPDAFGYSYTISVADNDAPYVRWGDERVTKTAEEILAADPTPREQAVRERSTEAQQWLQTKLQDEPQAAAAIYAAADREGISERDLKRAKRALGVTTEPMGYRGAWRMNMPDAAKERGRSDVSESARVLDLDTRPTLYRRPTLSESGKSGTSESDRFGHIRTLGQGREKCPTLGVLTCMAHAGSVGARAGRHEAAARIDFEQ